MGRKRGERQRRFVFPNAFAEWQKVKGVAEGRHGSGDQLRSLEGVGGSPFCVCHVQEVGRYPVGK